MTLRILSTLSVSSVILLGCATATLDVTVDLFDADPYERPPLSARKAEIMLTDLSKLKGEASRQHGLESSLAVESNQLCLSALKTLQPETENFQHCGTWNATMTVTEKDSPVCNEAKNVCDAPRPVEQKNFEENSSLESYLKKLKANQNKFELELNVAETHIKLYIQAYKEAYRQIVQGKCNALLKGSTKTSECIAQGLAMNVMELESRYFPSPYKNSRRRTQKNIFVEQAYLLDRQAVLSDIRNYAVQFTPSKLTDIACEGECDNAESLLKHELMRFANIRVINNSDKCEELDETEKSDNKQKCVVSDKKAKSDSGIGKEGVTNTQESPVFCQEDGQCILTLSALESLALNMVNDVVGSYRGLNQQNFYIDWLYIEHLLNRKLTTARINNESEAFQFWLDYAKSLQQQIFKLAKRAGYTSNSAGRSVAQPFADSSLQGSNLALANELESLRNDLPQSASSQMALEGLVKSKTSLNEMVDRLQNAGDPVWRIVTDPAFRNRWNQINKVYFRADGNTSVVIVRDAPARFRTSNAKNNPTVLATNQIIISKAIADAAIDTVGVFTGVPFPSGNSKQEQPTNPQSSPSVNVGVEKETLTLALAKRNKVLTNLKGELNKILFSIADADKTNASDIKEAKEGLDAILSAYKSVLEAGMNNNVQ
ncbi:hypothetical protein [Bowmanella denitrificans]|uniref:hypothetical protein n=1 Tax=Bowmanella denitrificans TaxID=366582 RepID=UPI000C9B2D97|nr:hypothetical protein [Bowmanella denitrificans]